MLRPEFLTLKICLFKKIIQQQTCTSRHLSTTFSIIDNPFVHTLKQVADIVLFYQKREGHFGGLLHLTPTRKCKTKYHP